MRMITIKNAYLSAKINEKGAELTSLKVNNREFIWDGNPAFWGKHSPILFPIVGTLRKNEYEYDAKKYNLSRHGFARDMEFMIKEQSESSVTFLLNSSDQSFENYPFEFELEVIYTLKNTKLTIQYVVSNKDKKQLPFSIGAHPAFALPESFENYSLTFNEDTDLTYFLLENDLLSKNTQTVDLLNHQLPLDYKLFEKDALVFKHINSKSITINEKDKPLLKVDFSDFPNLGIWTKVNAPFVCIEPWFGYSDTELNSGNIFEKEGIVVLEPNSDFISKFSIEIK